MNDKPGLGREVETSCVIGLLALVVTLTSGPTVATSVALPERDNPTPPIAQEEDKQQKRQPVHGKVNAVDPTAQTITVDGKVIWISSQTKLTKSGQAITVAQVKIGEDVHGMTRQTLDGKTEALTLKVGPLDERKQP